MTYLPTNMFALSPCKKICNAKYIRKVAMDGPVLRFTVHIKNNDPFEFLSHNSFQKWLHLLLLLKQIEFENKQVLFTARLSAI